MGKLFEALPINHQRFVTEWIKTCKYIDSARAAGSKARNLSQAGRQLLRKAEINAAVKEMQSELADSLEITPERVLREYARIAFSDTRNLFDEDGHLIPLHQLSQDQSAAIGGIDVNLAGDGDGGMVTVKKIKIWDKRGALDSLSKHLGLFEKDNEQGKTDNIVQIFESDSKL